MRVPSLIPCIVIASLSACGGPSRESKVATALQTMIADALSANIEIVRNAQPGTTAIDCSGGSGTLAFTTGLSVDPATGGATGTSTLTYDKCVVKACGETITLDGAGSTNVTITVDAMVAKKVTVEMTATNQSFSGLLNGDFSFAYKMTANADSESVSDLKLLDADTPTPLTVDGREYPADELNSLVDGC